MTDDNNKTENKPAVKTEKVTEPEIASTHVVGADTFYTDVDGNKWVERGDDK